MSFIVLITNTVSPSKLFLDGGTISLAVDTRIASVILTDNRNKSQASFGRGVNGANNLQPPNPHFKSLPFKNVDSDFDDVVVFLRNTEMTIVLIFSYCPDKGLTRDKAYKYKILDWLGVVYLFGLDLKWKFDDRRWGIWNILCSISTPAHYIFTKFMQHVLNIKINSRVYLYEKNQYLYNKNFVLCVFDKKFYNARKKFLKIRSLYNSHTSLRIYIYFFAFSYISWAYMYVYIDECCQFFFLRSLSKNRWRNGKPELKSRISMMSHFYV